MKNHALASRTLAVCLAIFFLAGCAVLTSPTPTPEPVVIHFAFPANLASYYDELIEQFNQEHPHITVERKTARSEETWRYLFRENQVDVFWFTSDGDLFQTLYEEGQVLNLTPLIQQSDAWDAQDFYPSLLEPYNIEGNTWALPAGVNLAVMYYNKDLFDRYNADYPAMNWTWDDLLMATLSTRDPDEGVYGLVGQPIFVVPFVYQHGGQIVDDWRAPARLTLDDPLTIEAIEWYAAMIHDYDVMPSPQSATAPIWQRRKPGLHLLAVQSGHVPGLLFRSRRRGVGTAGQVADELGNGPLAPRRARFHTWLADGLCRVGRHPASRGLLGVDDVSQRANPALCTSRPALSGRISRIHRSGGRRGRRGRSCIHRKRADPSGHPGNRP